MAAPAPLMTCALDRDVWLEAFAYDASLHAAGVVSCLLPASVVVDTGLCEEMGVPEDLRRGLSARHLCVFVDPVDGTREFVEGRLEVGVASGFFYETEKPDTTHFFGGKSSIQNRKS